MDDRERQVRVAKASELSQRTPPKPGTVLDRHR